MPFNIPNVMHTPMTLKIKKDCRQTDRHMELVTSSLLELLIAAKNQSAHSLKIVISIFIVSNDLSSLWSSITTEDLIHPTTTLILVLYH